MPRSETSCAAGLPRAPRIALFTHDTFGLGHVRRCMHLIAEISRRAADASILLITGSPALHALRKLPPNADYLKIPTVAFTGPEDGRPPHLRLPARDLISLRKRIVRGALDSFRPDLLLVDNFPLGSRKELLPTLERMSELGVPTVLGLRDIVDLPETVRRTWATEGIYDVLDRLYDRVLVYGLQEILDAGEAYGLAPRLAKKLSYCGYVTGRQQPLRPPGELHAELGLKPPLVLATVGGGGDGFPLLSAFVQAVRQLDVSAVAFTGPLMSPGDREKIRGLSIGAGGLAIREFVPDLPSYIAAADLVVAMGGYNTAAELLAQGRRALVMPRNWRYGEHARGTAAGVEWEQVLRSRALERIGLAETIDPETLDADSLAGMIARSLDAPPAVMPARLAIDGATRAVDRLFDLMNSEVRHAV